MSTNLTLRAEDDGNVIETVDELLRALDARGTRGDEVAAAAAHLIRMISVQAPDIIDLEEAELDEYVHDFNDQGADDATLERASND